jgi:PelA/Pel-15E family pectate lyase
VTLQPVKARAYELPSYSAHGETVDILNLLMDIENPSGRVVQAVTCAIDWLIAHEMKDVVIERFVNVDGKPDVRLVSRTGARGLWARYYDLQNAEPLFCDRDGVPRKCIDDIGYERRMGYSWFGDSPKNVIVRFGKWLKIIQ